MMKYWQKIFNCIILIICILTLGACGLTAKKTGPKKSNSYNNHLPVYTLTVEVNNSNGGKVFGAPDKSQYVAGTQVTLEALTNGHWNWRFSEWKFETEADWEDVTYEADYGRKITFMMNKDKKIRAVFISEFKDMCELIATPAAGCELMGKVVKTPDEYEYVENTPVKLEAVANDNYEFEKWIGTGISAANETQNPLYFNIGSLTNITAQFKLKP